MLKANGIPNNHKVDTEIVDWYKLQVFLEKEPVQSWRLWVWVPSSSSLPPSSPLRAVHAEGLCPLPCCGRSNPSVLPFCSSCTTWLTNALWHGDSEKKMCQRHHIGFPTNLPAAAGSPFTSSLESRIGGGKHQKYSGASQKPAVEVGAPSNSYTVCIRVSCAWRPAMLLWCQHVSQQKDTGPFRTGLVLPRQPLCF